MNFQSWLDPFIILMALPAALAGIVWFLFVTGTTISVPALTGAIMCMGVATANSILVISFSKEKLEAGKTPAEAALEAGFTRFRPVLMTALAMIIGMLPMSLGLGEGGEQNAPLGRAVIGGLLFATVATLFFVPVVFAIVHGWHRGKDIRQVLPRETNADRKSSNIFEAARYEGECVIDGKQARRSCGAADGQANTARLLGHRRAVDRGGRRRCGDRPAAESQGRPAHRDERFGGSHRVRDSSEARRAAAEIILPGNIQAFTDSPIYARTNGYLKKWYVDIGAHVKAGQLLAEIETPEVDQQLDQARADLNTAQANYQLSEITATRYQDLLKTDSVSKQDVDNAIGDFAAKKAMVASAQSNVKRLEELQSFEKIYAPFDGVITARNTDVGHLINSGAGGPATELFHIAAIRTLRVYINVPQQYSQAAKPGITADSDAAGISRARFQGKLVRTADAIDLASRTLLVEVDVDNPSGELLPGAYTEVHLKVPSGVPALILPVSALIFRSEGLQVGTVQNGNRAALTRITLGRDMGSEVEVVSGVTANDLVIANPPDSLISGETVRVVTPGRMPTGTMRPAPPE